MSNDETWIQVGSSTDLAEGSMRGVEHGDLQIAIYNLEGEFYATDNICSHAFALLTDGFMDGDIVECPLHGGCFKIRTGEGQGAPISEDIKTYPVRVMNDVIEVRIS